MPIQLVVVGGGVAGVCCVEELESLLEDESVLRNNSDLRAAEILLITGRSGFIKTVANAEKLGQITETFDVKESVPSEYFESRRVKVVQSDVTSWSAEAKSLTLSCGSTVHYDRLCIATGGSAKRTLKGNPHVLTIRDTQTIEELQNQLKTARRVLIVGNGGIATELVFELKDVEIVWAIQHSSISATYFDEAAAKFFEAKLSSGRQSEDDVKPEALQKRYTIVGEERTRKQEHSSAPSTSNHAGSAEKDDGAGSTGCALGPHWLERLGQGSGTEQGCRKVTVVRDVQLSGVYEQFPTDKRGAAASPEESGWLVWAELTNGDIIGCDLIVEATGVRPNSQVPWRRDCQELDVEPEDDGILVDERMLTNAKDVYAAGDVCSARWTGSQPHWMQIRLWTQARQMGMFVARSMLIPDVPLDIAFEIFTHATTYFGYKVVLLGDFLANKVQQPFNFHYRISGEREYVKLVVGQHKIHGAVLIGETDLEEAIENLILNGTDIRQIEGDLLNPEVDLEDYFD